MISHEPQRERFPLGRVVATAGLLAQVSAEEVSSALARHARGDWGEVCEEDLAANEEAMKHGDRLLSAYSLPLATDASSTVRIYVITEADRSVTTALLCEEY